ncbi:hypothetical protein [Solirubrobacter soli]|uniref:hypothetical protein n=1 Tax=Solirubrobacter soli TaxID=363832 RepID=UPI00040A8082|nr:hypothetical protein [Solirubrobacter soli]
MQIHEHLGHASLAGWRKTVADVVAPRLPIDDDTARTIIGLGFFAMSVYYVGATVAKALRRR